MKHQITLVGGQILPVYLGVVERKPDVVHCLYSKDSRNHWNNLKKILGKGQANGHQVNPFDYEEIKSKVEAIIFANPNDNFELNITGGTKIMAIACQQIFNDLSLPIFYIDQKHVLFEIRDKKHINLSTKLTLDNFLKLSGHSVYTSESFNTIPQDYITLAEFVLKNINARWYWDVYGKLNKKNRLLTPKSFYHKHGNVEVHWDGSQLSVKNGSGTTYFNGKKCLALAFSGFWWEILIGKSVLNWKGALEFRINLSIKSRTTNQLPKNEIDIVLNTGRNLIFIECKAGNVTQDDVNKIKAVADLYGGVSSRSILVARKNPSPEILEKCEELGIDVFSHEFSVKSSRGSQRIYTFVQLSDLQKRLDHLLTKFHL